MSDFIKIRGAREHNLKNISLDIPKNKLVVMTGVSGSGKSSLAFDTIYAEGQRRYVESLSSKIPAPLSVPLLRFMITSGFFIAASAIPIVQIVILKSAN